MMVVCMYVCVCMYVGGGGGSLGIREAEELYMKEEGLREEVQVCRYVGR